jgi:hypothetical protein
MTPDQQSTIEVGKRYHVIAEDCCSEVEFTATLLEAPTSVEYDEKTDEPRHVPCAADDWKARTVWDNGLTLQCAIGEATLVE